MAETSALFLKVTVELLEHFKELHADTWLSSSSGGREYYGQLCAKFGH
jgi:hypothetical protein